LVLVTFVEELVYRGFVQERVSHRCGNLIAIVAASLFMALMHWAPGDPLAVALDLAFVFLDSIMYGLLYARTQSILVSWTAHLGVDLFDIALML
jgi:membrane protease YdiL (CAAX protease family)